MNSTSDHRDTMPGAAHLVWRDRDFDPSSVEVLSVGGTNPGDVLDATCQALDQLKQLDQSASGSRPAVVADVDAACGDPLDEDVHVALCATLAAAGVDGIATHRERTARRCFDTAAAIRAETIEVLE